MEVLMEKIFLLHGLDCANCAAKIEREAAKLPGVQRVNVSFLTTKMTVEVTPEEAGNLFASVKKLVKKHLDDVTVEEQ